MIALGSPWALLGLLSLPVLVWIHRRRRRAVPVDVPSVLFLEAELAEPAVPERVRLDAELLLALAAAAFLALAAAGPRVSSASRGRTVRVVVDRGPAMQTGTTAKDMAAVRADGAIAAIRRALASGDKLEQVDATGEIDALAREARVGKADLRVVVSDRLPRPELADVRFVAVGDPSAGNVGIVAAAVESRPDGARVFANVWNDDPETVVARVMFEADGRPAGEAFSLSVPAGTARSATFDLTAAPTEVVVRISPGGDLALDDAVRLRREPLRVRFAEGAQAYPEPYRAAVLSGLRASLGEGGLVEGAADAELLVGEEALPVPRPPRSYPLRLVLRPVPSGVEGVRPGSGARFQVPAPPYGKDLDPAGCDLVYAPRPAVSEPFPLVELVREDDAPLTVVFSPDPLAGHPAPVDHPLWAIFIDDVVTAIRGRALSGGWRARGTLDPEVTRLGRDVRPFDPAWLEGVAPAQRPRERDLKLLLVAAGAVCLGLLWVRPTRTVGQRVP